MSELITPEWLRSRDFRICSTDADNRPHMVIVYGKSHDLALEVSRGIITGWTVWGRSDISHTRCRFIFLRNVERTDQLERLYHSLTDKPLPHVEFDAEQFRESWERESAECQRRYAEYCKNSRWSHVPG